MLNALPDYLMMVNSFSWSSVLPYLKDTNDKYFYTSHPTGSIADLDLNFVLMEVLGLRTHPFFAITNPALISK